MPLDPAFSCSHAHCNHSNIIPGRLLGHMQNLVNGNGGWLLFSLACASSVDMADESCGFVGHLPRKSFSHASSAQSRPTFLFLTILLVRISHGTTSHLDLWSFSLPFLHYYIRGERKNCRYMSLFPLIRTPLCT